MPIRRARLLPIRSVVSLSVIAGVVACGQHPKPPPTTCVPLTPTNMPGFPAATATEQYPETITVNNGAIGTLDWADGRGYVHASIDDVWKALQNDGVVADRRELQQSPPGWSITKSNVDSTVDVSFILTCITNEGGFPYSVLWRELATSGTEAAPTAVLACGDLNQSAVLAGMDLMSILSDSIQLGVINSTTTSYTVTRHRGPLESTPAACQQYVEDVFNSVVAQVHGMPLPANQN